MHFPASAVRRLREAGSKQQNICAEILVHPMVGSEDEMWSCAKKGCSKIFVRGSGCSDRDFVLFLNQERCDSVPSGAPVRCRTGTP